MREFKQHLPLLIALVLLYVVFGSLRPKFFEGSTVDEILEHITINALLAFGMTFVILTGGIDLSVGSTLAAAGVVSVLIADATGSFPLALAGGTGMGVAVGTFNGVLVAFGRLPPFIVTLGTMSIARGLAFAFTVKPLDLEHSLFRQVASYPYWQYCYLLFFFALCGFLLKSTRFGHYVYAIGGNREAARFTGIPIRRVELSVYVLSGTIAGVAGVINSAVLWSGAPDAGIMFELNAIAAVVVGGTSFVGGVGTLTGTAFGAVIIGVLATGLDFLNVQFYFQYMVKGLVVLLAVSLDVVRRRGRD